MMRKVLRQQRMAGHTHQHVESTDSVLEEQWRVVVEKISARFSNLGLASALLLGSAVSLFDHEFKGHTDMVVWSRYAYGMLMGITVVMTTVVVLICIVLINAAMLLPADMMEYYMDTTKYAEKLPWLLTVLGTFFQFAAIVIRLENEYSAAHAAVVGTVAGGSLWYTWSLYSTLFSAVYNSHGLVDTVDTEDEHDDASYQALKLANAS
jgi:hypothetical protein